MVPYTNTTHKCHTKTNKQTYLNKYLKVFAADWNKISYGIKFHKNGATTKKRYINSLMVEDAKFKVKERVHVANLLN